MVPVIVLSSHTTGLGVTRALGEMGVQVTSVSYDDADMGQCSKYVRRSISAPHPERNEEQFLQLLLESRARTGRSVLIPADDVSLMVVSRNRDLLAESFIVACPDYSVTERLLDKKYTYALAHSLGIPAPRTMIPKTPEELHELANAVRYPCLVKPCLSHRYFDLFQRKLLRVEDAVALIAAWHESTNAGAEVMVQEYIPGDDTEGVNYNSYFWEGQPLVEFTAAKVRLSPPQFGVPSVVVSRDIPEVIESGRRILRGLGYNGYSCVEFKKDYRDGVYKLMEVNGRHNRSTLLAVRCGINFPWLEYRHLVHGEQPQARDYRKEVYWIDEFRDLHQWTSLGWLEWPRALRYGGPYLRRHVFSVFDWHDFKPFCKRSIRLFKQLFQENSRQQVTMKRGFANEK